MEKKKMAKFQFKCPQCGKTLEADDSVCGQTAACPYCGEGIIVPRKQFKRLASNSQSSVPERTIIETHPAIINYVDTFIFVFLTGFGMKPIFWICEKIFRIQVSMIAFEFVILLITFLLVKLICCTTKYVVTNKRIISEAGILTTSTTAVFHSDIRAISIKRSLFQRLFNLADIFIATAATSGAEVVLHGVPDWERVHEIIESYRRERQSAVSQELR